MGFFKDFKDDLTQAVNELLPDDVFTDDDNELLFTDDEVVNTLDDVASDDDKAVTISDQERADKIDANVEAFLQKVKALDENGELDDDMGFNLDDVMTEDDETLFADTAGEEPIEEGESLVKEDPNDLISEEDVDQEMIDEAEQSLTEDVEDETTQTEDSELVEDLVEDVEELEEIKLDDIKEQTDMDNDRIEDLIETTDIEESVSSSDKEEDTMITEIAKENEQEDDVIGLQEVKPERPVNGSEVTVIAKSTIINGSISSAGSLEVYGTVEGDIDCGAKLSINGVVKGNSKAQEVFINAKRLEGNVISTGNLKVGQGTVIVGDITASAGVIAGAIKGQIDVSGAVVLDSTAIVKGNIKAKSVQVNNGAVVDGYCSLTYADVDLDNVFDAE